MTFFMVFTWPQVLSSLINTCLSSVSSLGQHWDALTSSSTPPAPSLTPRSCSRPPWRAPTTARGATPSFCPNSELTKIMFLNPKGDFFKFNNFKTRSLLLFELWDTALLKEWSVIRHVISKSQDSCTARSRRAGMWHAGSREADAIITHFQLTNSNCSTGVFVQ